MAKIDCVEYLPEWFNLQKYRGCESFGAVDWYNCLAVRQGALCVLRALIKHGFSVEDFYSPEDFRPHELMRSDPLNWRSVRAIHWGEKKAGSILPDTPVRPLEFVDLLFQRSSDWEDEYEGRPNSRAELWSLFDNHDWLTVMNNLDGMPVGAVDGCLETIKVNMEATDAVLIDAFTAWLKDAREKQSNNTSKRERPAYQDWERYGLLPYLDLLIWAKETGNHIPHHVMAQAVGYSRGGDSFRKTVQKLACELMRSLAELEALAAIEASPEKLGA